MKMINYSFNVEKFVKNEALFVQSLNKYLWLKMNSLPGLLVFSHYLYQFDLK